MPYHIIKQGEKHCIAKEGEDTPIAGGCHATEAEARDHMAALYANEPDAKARRDSLKRARLAKAMSDAPNLRGASARACWNCAHFQPVEGAYDDGACAQFDFQTEGGWMCDMWTAMPPQPLAVTVVEAGGEMSNAAMMSRRAAKGLAIPNYIKALHLPHDEQFLRDVLAVKFIGKDDIKGYVILWGDENLVDLEAEFFTPQTDFWKSVLGFPRPLSWNHAQDKAAFTAHPVIGKMMKFGEDKVGMFYNAVLDRAHEYRRAVDALISKRVVGTSSDSAPQYVERVKTKKGATWLKTWPLFAAALSDVPCEPRMIEQGNVYWKNVGVNWDALCIPAFPNMSAEASQAAARAALENRIANAQRHHDLLSRYLD